MPKLFPINIEVEELAVGKVMRQLHNTPGVAKVSLDLGDPKPAGDVRHAPKKFGNSGNDVIAEAMSRHNPITSEELRSAFAAAGRSPKSVASQLYSMQESGLVKKSGDGKWAMTKKLRDRLRWKKK